MSPPSPAELGEVVAGYRLDSVLGHGGMAWVFLGTHVALGRRAAIKVLGSPYADDDSHVSRFFSEAKVVNDIRHPNIVDIIDFAETAHPRRVAYVMEYLSGTPLSDVPPLSLRQAVNICLQLSHALQAVHEVNVVHRDLKPENVILVGALTTDLSLTPCVKLVDFGIAKIDDPTAAHKTATGQVLGTPSFMAPEQVAGEPVSAATDVYALGEIFYELVTGNRLFVGTTPMILKMKLLAQTPPLEIPPEVPRRAEIEELILTCLSFEPSRRPSMKAVWQKLVTMLETLPPHARSSLPTPPRASWAPSGPSGPARSGDERTLDLPAEPMLGNPANTASLSQALADDVSISRPTSMTTKVVVAASLGVVALLAVAVATWTLKPAEKVAPIPQASAAQPEEVLVEEAPDPEPTPVRELPENAAVPSAPPVAVQPAGAASHEPRALAASAKKAKKAKATKKSPPKKAKKRADSMERKLDESIEALSDSETN